LLPAGGDGTTIYLRATFGVLVSHDAGGSWRWMCERALGFSSTWDPPLAATRDGRLWIALPDGLRSTVDGCATTEAGALSAQTVADLALGGADDRVFAVTSSPAKPSFVWRQEGASFARLGKGVSGFRFDTIEVAPSKPSRVYLTGIPEAKGTTAHIFRSDDGGATLTELPTVSQPDARLFIAAVDPHDADRLYVRALSGKGSDVLLSTDGGKTFSSVFHMKGAMFGFARTRDGSALYAGSGDPSEGIWRSTDQGATWQPRAKTSVLCLNADGPKLLVCSNPYLPGGYAVAESSDQGATVKPLATFDGIVGPVACDGGSACEASWPETRAAIVTRAHASPPMAVAVDAAVPSDAGSGSVAKRAGGCGCRAAGAGGAPSGGGASVVLAALLALDLRRRRRTLDRAVPR
jgi:MYXO-CTERM domain-containing protein